MPRRGRKQRSGEEAVRVYLIQGQKIEDRAPQGDTFVLWQSDPFKAWLASIRDLKMQARIDYHLTKMSSGLFGDWKPAGHEIKELRLDFGPGYRIYYKQVGRAILLLLGGGDKGTQERDIQSAERLWKEIKDGLDPL